MPKGHRFRLSKATIAALDEFRDSRDAFVQALESEHGRHRDAWDESTEKWQEGDRGSAVDGWIETLDDLKNELEAIEDPNEEPQD